MTTSNKTSVIVGSTREVNHTRDIQLLFEGLDRQEEKALNYTDMYGLASYLYS